MRIRNLARLSVAVGVLLSLGVSSAWAVGGPSEKPIEIKKFTFDVGGKSFATSAYPRTPTSSAYWGVTTRVFESGGRSLWCAATKNPDDGTASAYWPNYRPNTAGQASATLTETADYYDSSVTFSYLMPSLGSADHLYGRLMDGSGKVLYADTFIPPVTAWTTRKYELAPYGLARSESKLEFLFYDDYEFTGGLGGGSDITGQGPAIDNVVVSGYKYGPVRNLIPLQSTPGTVTLSWDGPVEKLRSNTLEGRPIAFRVWRSLANQYNWIELTSAGSRVAGSPISYAQPATIGGYDYKVQTWDAGSGTGYGQVGPQVSWPPRAAVALSSPAVPSGGFITNVPFSVTGTVSLHTAAAPVQVQVSQNKSTIVGTFWGASLANSTAFTVSGIKVTSPGTWYMRARHADGGHSESLSNWIPITVNLPLATLGAPSKPSGTVYMWTSFTTTGRIAQTHTSVAPMLIDFSRNGSTITKTVAGSVGARSTTYAATGLKFLAAGTWYIRARHQDATHRSSVSPWTKIVVSPLVKVTAPRVKSHSGRTYSVYGTIKPRHTSTYLKVYAYRWNGRKYAYVKSFSVRATNTGQAVDTTKYTASVRFTKKGNWKLRLRHAGHAGEATRYSAYSSRITVK